MAGGEVAQCFDEKPDAEHKDESKADDPRSGKKRQIPIVQVSIFIIRNAVEDLYADGVVGHAQRMGEKELDALLPDRAANTIGRGFDISADRHFLRRLWQLLGS